MSYDVGDQVRLRARFYKNADTVPELEDPTDVTLKIKKPDGEVLEPDPVRADEGDYHFDQLLDVSGTWRHRWEGTGLVPAADEGSFPVRESAF